jgi:lipopolysaccharide biosynthesis glycosyltransferase
VPVFGHVSKATYFRLLLPDMLPANETEAIYVDVDAVVLGDLSSLSKTALNGRTVGAVRDGASLATGRGLPGLDCLGLSPDAPRFNGGVLLIDLQKWRTARITEQCLSYLRRYHEYVQFWDQDALNAVLAFDWTELARGWNYRVDCHVPPNAAVPVAEYLAAIRGDANIVHYASATKPWHYYADHPGKIFFYEYLDRTAWKGWRPHPPLRALRNPFFWGGIFRGNPLLNRVRLGLHATARFFRAWGRS